MPRCAACCYLHERAAGIEEPTAAGWFQRPDFLASWVAEAAVVGPDAGCGAEEYQLPPALGERYVEDPESGRGSGIAPGRVRAGPRVDHNDLGPWRCGRTYSGRRDDDRDLGSI